LVKLFIIFFILFFHHESFCGIDFSLGERVRILSDKGYRYTSENKFIAEGNVIIVSEENTLYGNKAKIFLDDQKFIIEEDVKLVNPEFSLLGESFEFLSSSQKLELSKAMIITDNYKVVGERAKRQGKGDIILENASYTTCKDCPNSWAFSGDKIFVTPGQYVRIKGAYFVISGVNVLYLPYFFFPIKKERESGFLFPKVSVNLNDGTFLQIPYFQTIGESADITLTPTLWGRWGFGGEFQMRKAFSNRNLFQIESKFVQEYSTENKKVHVSSMDFSFWSEDERLKLFFTFDISNDYDSFNRFERYIDQEYFRPDFGGEIRLGYTGGSLEASLAASKRSNLISPNSNGLDPNYVQIAPELKLDFVGKNILSFRNFPIVNSEISFEFSQFRQNEFNQASYSRNTDRMILNGQLNIFYNSLFPYGNVRSEHLFRYSRYDLKYEDKKEDLYRNEVFHLFNFELPFVKRFGKAQISNLEPDQKLPNRIKSKYVKNSSVALSDAKVFLEDEDVLIEKALIHKLGLNFNFYHLGNAYYNGKGEVYGQFSDQNYNPNTSGLFDFKDSFYTFENNIQANSTLSALQRTNTLELLIVNNFFSESPNINSDDGLKKVDYLGTFRLSQGVLMRNKFVNETELSRLLLGAKTNMFGVNFDLTDSYFHNSREHLLSLVFDKSFSKFSIAGQLIYDGRTVPYNKILNSRLGLFLNPEIKVSYNFSYDISVQKLNYEDYLIRYLPSNDCWFLEFNYFTDRIQSRYSVNFMLNLNEKQFKNDARL